VLHAVVNLSPAFTVPGELEYAVVGSGVDHSGIYGVDGERRDFSILQTAADSSPAYTAFGSLKYAVRGSDVDHSGVYRVDGERMNIFA